MTWTREPDFQKSMLFSSWAGRTRNACHSYFFSVGITNTKLIASEFSRKEPHLKLPIRLGSGKPTDYKDTAYWWKFWAFYFLLLLGLMSVTYQKCGKTLSLIILSVQPKVDYGNFQTELFYDWIWAMNVNAQQIYLRGICTSLLPLTASKF